MSLGNGPSGLHGSEFKIRDFNSSYLFIISSEKRAMTIFSPPPSLQIIPMSSVFSCTVQAYSRFGGLLNFGYRQKNSMRRSLHVDILPPRPY